jgi:uncharacterized protein DUF5677
VTFWTEDETTVTVQLPNNNAFADFAKRHLSVLQALDDMAAGFESLFVAVNKPDSSTETETLFFLASAAYTEFEEVIVLATSGYGSGATKLLRALYERTITAQYLMQRPDKVQQFIDYSHVHWHKLLAEADSSGVGKQLSGERRKEIEDNLDGVRARFTETVCKPCQKTRLQSSWTSKPIPSQAAEIHDDLRLLCFSAYLMPTFFLHTTHWGVSQQVIHWGDGTKQLHNREAELKYADKAIALACNLMAHFASSYNAFFKLDCEAHCTKIADAVNLIGKELLSGEANP